MEGGTRNEKILGYVIFIGIVFGGSCVDGNRLCEEGDSTASCCDN